MISGFGLNFTLLLAFDEPLPDGERSGLLPPAARPLFRLCLHESMKELRNLAALNSAFLGAMGSWCTSDIHDCSESF